ncbi:MAG: cobyrinic acid a,c-diamide synthase, partial [Acetatifactor sp.]|nr:cobyrinic acid a,c-diamide synthase [Acetatifactor sp.]
MKNAFMIAATGSGCGKTTITCALLEALKRRGESVRSFKCGPDYIDPMFHREILGIPSKNLDLFFAEEALARELFFLENDSDISVVEGVMGLYDGMHAGSEEGSSYHLACALNIPIILVVDAHGMGRSMLAL